MKKIKHIFILSLALFSIASCSDYLDINEDPNNPQAESLNPDLILPAALTGPFSTFTSTGNYLGNSMMQNWAGDVTSVTGGFVEEFTLTGIDNTFYAGIWDGLFSSTANLTAIINTDFPNYENHIAVAKIMRAFYFQYLVDLYGDIPFTEMHQFQENLTPAYDDAESVYRALLQDLTDAVDLINNNTNLDTEELADADVVFAGNMAMWEKFANTIKLRILLRESLRTTGDASFVSNQIAALSGQPLLGAGETVTINPGYSNDAGKQNPYFASYGEDSGGNATFNRDFIRAADYAVQFLNGSTNGIFDNRINGIYEAESGFAILGIVQGETNDTATPNSARIGPSLVISSEQDGILMTSSESLLLQAEAAEYYGFPGSGLDYFQQAITDSFAFHGLAMGTYMTDIETDNGTIDGEGLGWNTTTDKREAIMTQKWIALNGINGLESFVEYTRTGYPDVPLAINASRPARFIRLLYPQSEYISNSANVPQQSNSDMFSVPVFWNE
ncbi:SusD/RagB family nutrient-binding outer membrane lipoprotein [Mangrovimonas cancribranchiae]|uniref:SusD/RagB family nutrient-binding outer membrane lipoprotein n=1 Tax=Mangrovimonas cancribranchiae TaxID=3080055 RepID=A0AAU6P346_9FLAO